MAIFSARMRFSTFGGAFRISAPSKRTLPVAAPFLASRPMMAKASCDLPLPLSPTMPSVSPGARSRSMPLTALTVPSFVWNRTLRSRTERRAVMSAVLGVERVAQAVADKEEGEQRHDEEAEREQQLPQRAVVHRPRAFGDQGAP